MQNVNQPGTVGYQAVALHFTQSQATVPEKKRKCQVIKLPSLAPFVRQTSMNSSRLPSTTRKTVLTVNRVVLN